MSGNAEQNEQRRRRASAAGRALARLGARKGGQARAKKLSQAERSDIAHRGGKARWGLAPDPNGASAPKKRPGRRAVA